MTEPPRETPDYDVSAMECDLCEEHYAWTCACGNRLDQYQVVTFPEEVTCGVCKRVYTITEDWDRWWAEHVPGVPRR